MKKSITLLFGVLFLISFPSSLAFTIESGVPIEPTASNTRYNFSTSYILSRLEVQSTTPYFNGNIFQIEPDSGIANVTIIKLSPANTTFNVTATDNTNFIIGDLTSNTLYSVEVDGVPWNNYTSSSSGLIQFNYSSWSTHTFIITRYTEAEVEFVKEDNTLTLTPTYRFNAMGFTVRGKYNESTAIINPDIYYGSYYYFWTKEYAVTSKVAYGLKRGTYERIRISTKRMRGNFEILYSNDDIYIENIQDYDKIIVVLNPGFFDRSKFWFNVLH